MRAFANDFGADDQVSGNNFSELTYIVIRAAFGDLIEHVLAADHPAKCGRISVELGRRYQGDEKLAACFSGAVLSHRYGSAEMTARRGQIKLVRYVVTGTAESIIGRIGILRIGIAADNHVACFRPIERSAVVKASLNQMNEVIHSCRGLVFE